MKTQFNYFNNILDIVRSIDSVMKPNHNFVATDFDLSTHQPHYQCQDIKFTWSLQREKDVRMLIMILDVCVI